MTKLRYSVREDNKILDGKVHSIIPLGITKIEDLPLFLLDYYDEDYSAKLSTLVTVKDHEIVDMRPTSFNSFYYLFAVFVTFIPDQHPLLGQFSECVCLLKVEMMHTVVIELDHLYRMVFDSLQHYGH